MGFNVFLLCCGSYKNHLGHVILRRSTVYFSFILFFPEFTENMQLLLSKLSCWPLHRGFIINLGAKYFTLIIPCKCLSSYQFLKTSALRKRLCLGLNCMKHLAKIISLIEHKHFRDLYVTMDKFFEYYC